MASDKVVVLDGSNFEAEVLKAEGPVLVDFWAAWCGPCKMIAPILDQLAEEFDGKAKVAKVNVDDNRDLATRYKVMSIPTLLLFKGGDVLSQAVGARPKGELAKMLNGAL